MTFDENEISILNTALDASLASNKRMQVSKPQFAVIFNKIHNDITALRLKINTPEPVLIKKDSK